MSDPSSASGRNTDSAIALDARGIVEQLFPGAFSLRKFRSLDAAGLCPRGFNVGGRRKLFRVSDYRKWVALGFPNRAEFEAATEGERK